MCAMTNNTQQARKNQRHFHHRWVLLESSKMVLAFVVLSSFLLLLLQLPTPTNASHVIDLTGANYEEATKGRTVFLKFFAPWCGHCRAMAGDWEQLADDWKDHPVGMIGEIDCTTEEGLALCEDFEIQGFPTLLHGDPMSPETYEGERDYDSMSQFAKEHISKPVCSVYKVENCEQEELVIIKDLRSKTKQELVEIAERVEAKVGQAEEEFDLKVGELQKQYDALTEDFNAKLDVIKAEGQYKFVQQILQSTEYQDEHDGTEGQGDEL